MRWNRRRERGSWTALMAQTAERDTPSTSRKTHGRVEATSTHISPVKPWVIANGIWWQPSSDPNRVPSTCFHTARKKSEPLTSRGAAQLPRTVHPRIHVRRIPKEGKQIATGYGTSLRWAQRYPSIVKPTLTLYTSTPQPTAECISTWRLSPSTCWKLCTGEADE